MLLLLDSMGQPKQYTTAHSHFSPWWNADFLTHVQLSRDKAVYQLITLTKTVALEAITYNHVCVESLEWYNQGNIGVNSQLSTCNRTSQFSPRYNTVSFLPVNDHHNYFPCKYICWRVNWFNIVTGCWYGWNPYRTQNIHWVAHTLNPKPTSIGCLLDTNQMRRLWVTGAV